MTPAPPPFPYLIGTLDEAVHPEKFLSVIIRRNSTTSSRAYTKRLMRSFTENHFKKYDQLHSISA